MGAVVLSNSRRGKVTGCKYRYFLEQVLGLSREREAIPLRLGSLWHEYLKRGLQGSWLEGREVLEDPEVQGDPEIGPLVLGMARNVEPQIREFLDGYEVIGVEIPFFLRIVRSPRGGFKVSLVDPPTPEVLAAERGFVLYYGGVLDAVLKDRDTGHLWVWEHKTTVATDRDRFERDMDASFQVLGYMYAAALMFSDPVCGVLFDAARKKLPGVPKLNQCKWCKGTGWQEQKVKEAGVTVPIRQICPVCEGSGKGLFSATVIETTGDAIDEAFAGAPHLKKPEYSEWREGAFREWRAECLRVSKPFWFVYHKPIRWEQMQAWLADTWQVARQYNVMLKKPEEKEFPRHLDSLTCSRCPMRSLCLDGGEWDRSEAPLGYVKKSVPVIPHEIGGSSERVEDETPPPDEDFLGF